MGYKEREVSRVPLGCVSSEGGPLLLLDAALAGSWSGIDGADYERACESLDEAEDAAGGEISIGPASGVLWEHGGPGSAYVFSVRDGIALVRWWGRDAEAEPDARLLDLPAKEQRRLGELRVTTGRLLVLWAAENGGDVEGLPEPPVGPARGDLAVADAGYVAECDLGRFEVVQDSFDGPSGPGKRCWIRRISE